MKYIVCIVWLLSSASYGFAQSDTCAPQAIDTLTHEKTTPFQVAAVADTTGSVTAADTTNLYCINEVYLRSIWQDLKYTVARPAHWQQKNWLQFGAVAAGAGLLIGADHSVKQFFIHNQTTAVTSITNQIEPWGNAYSPYLVGAAYMAGMILHDRKLESGSLMAAKSLLISTAIYTAIKSVVRRGRPTYFNDNLNFKPPFTRDKYHTSFPSGHSNTVITVATAIVELYGKDHPWVPWVAYSVAGLTGVTRMYQNRHWSSDVLVGMALGHFVTQSVFRHQRAKEHKLVMKKMLY